MGPGVSGIVGLQPFSVTPALQPTRDLPPSLAGFIATRSKAPSEDAANVVDDEVVRHAAAFDEAGAILVSTWTAVAVSTKMRYGCHTTSSFSLSEVVVVAPARLGTSGRGFLVSWHCGSCMGVTFGISSSCRCD